MILITGTFKSSNLLEAGSINESRSSFKENFTHLLFGNTHEALNLPLVLIMSYSWCLDLEDVGFLCQRCVVSM